MWDTRFGGVIRTVGWGAAGGTGENVFAPVNPPRIHYLENGLVGDAADAWGAG